jgi:hypothetical protein
MCTMNENRGDTNVIDFVVSYLKCMENVLKRIKYTRQDLAAMEVVLEHFKETGKGFAKKRDEIEERLKSDSMELWAQRFDILHEQTMTS